MALRGSEPEKVVFFVLKKKNPEKLLPFSGRLCYNGQRTTGSEKT